jgi:hypothetical protein
MIFVDFVEKKKNWGWTSPRPVEKKKELCLMVWGNCGLSRPLSKVPFFDKLFMNYWIY